MPLHFPKLRPSRAKPIKTLVCVECGNLFHHRVPHANTCSPECKAEHHRKASRASMQAYRAKQKEPSPCN